MLKTQNYGFNKPELSDSPPDITVMNSNWDTIDKKIKENTDAIAQNREAIGQVGKYNKNLSESDDLFLLSGEKHTIYNITDKTPINSPIEGFVYGTVEYIPTTQGNGNRILIASGRGTLLAGGRKWFCTVRNDGVPYDNGWYEFATTNRSFIARADLYSSLGTMDLNQAKTLGAYLCVETPSILYKNKPPFIGWFTILIYEGGTGAIIQEAIQNSYGTRCYREFNGSVWSEWKIIATSNNISNPNLLINGDFQIWQRGMNFLNVVCENARYTADRWKSEVSPSAKVNIIKDNDGSLKFTQIGNYTSNLRQYIEGDYKNLLGKKVTFSILVKNNIQFTMGILNGNSGIVSRNVEVSSEYKLISITGELPELISKNVLNCIFWFNNNSGDINIKWAKLEVGEIATPLSTRSYGEELALCQRYYINFGTTNYCHITFCKYVRGTMWGMMPLPVPMRINPTPIFTDDFTLYIDIADDVKYIAKKDFSILPYEQKYGNGISYIVANMNAPIDFSGMLVKSANKTFELDAEIY